MIRRPPRYPLIPYTTLFRSLVILIARFVRATKPARRVYSPVLLAAAATTVTMNLGWFVEGLGVDVLDRKSTRLNSSHANISYAVFCLKKTQSILIRSAYDTS